MANIFIFVISIVDVTVIGRILGVDDLEYYSIAMGIAGLLTTQVGTPMNSVMFPSLLVLVGRKYNHQDNNLNEFYFSSSISSSLDI